MVKVDGKDVFTELSELVAPDYTALVVIDMQRDFVEPDGLFGRLGIDVSAYGAVRPAIAALRAAARGDRPPLRYTVPGTPGHVIVDELTPRDGELVVTKYRSSALWGTNLELLLRSNGIRSVVLAGCTTEGCVESTARDTMFNDYYVVLATDCVASDDQAQHEAAMLLMRHRFDLASAGDIVGAWASAVRPASRVAVDA